MKDLVHSIVRHLVEYPELVRITEMVGDYTIVLEISVAASDMGKILGKNGKIVNAIRVILMSIASAKKMRVNLEVLEPIDHPLLREIIHE